MEKVILISGQSLKFLASESISGYTVIVDEKPVQAINSIVERTEASLFVLIVIHHDEYADVNRHLNLLPYHRIFYQILIFGSESQLEKHQLQRLYHITDYRTAPVTPSELHFIVEKAFSLIGEFYQTDQSRNRFMSKLIDAHQDQEALIDIGKALQVEKDPEKLLRLILFMSKKITGADAGSIYLVEEAPDTGVKRLRFKYSHTFSRDIPLEEFVMNLDTRSIAGYVAVTGQVLNIPNAYQLPPEAPYSFNTFFDRENSYISRSMLVVPMRNHVDEIIGVIQLLNSKEALDGDPRAEPGNEAFTLKLEDPSDFDRYVVTFSSKYNSLMEAVASQAAIAIENNRLIKTIETQFEEFVKASVSAIESQDPATSGHSFRVAEICSAMARAINEIDEGYLKPFNFSETAIRELEYAALLHDFGKVYVDLSIYKKAKKLYPAEYENLQLRLDYLYRYLQYLYSSKEDRLLKEHNPDDVRELAKQIARDRDRHLERIVEIKQMIHDLNEPRLTTDNPGAAIDAIIDEINGLHCLNLEGNEISVITDHDRINLSIARGSLNDRERHEIESHVVHTYSFVSRIPWPREYRNIPEIARSHHEKLDGTGYPNGLKGRESTLLQSRIMAVADIFDALAAKDRPYKKAVPIDKVIEIMKKEAEDGKLDPDIVNLFIEKKIYERIDLEAAAG